MRTLKTKKKYLFINSLQAGGAERQAIALLDFINFERVFLIAPLIDYPIKNPVRALSFIRNINNPLYALISILYSFCTFSFRISRYSTVVSFLEYANFINILTKYIRPHEAIINIQIIPSVQYRKKQYWFHNFLIRKLYPKAEKICCNSLLIKSNLIKSYKIPSEHIKVIYNSYDLQSIENLSKEPLIDSEFAIFQKYPVLINAARLNENKAQWNLIRVFKELRQRNSQLKLVILGKGELKGILSTLSNSLGLRTFVYDSGQPLTEDYDVYLWGFTKNPFKLIKNAQWFIFTSLLEGMPNSVIESIICGTPVISSDCLSGPREILNDEVNIDAPISKIEYAKYGLLMPVFEGEILDAQVPITPKEHLWINTLVRVIFDENLRLQYHNKSTERALDFDYQRKISDWQNLIEKLL